MRPMSEIPISPYDTLRAGLALIAAAPPHVGTYLPRGPRLVLQSRLLEALPEWSPPRHFRIRWRTVFSWGCNARIATGTVCWQTPAGTRTAAFAVDAQACSLVPPSMSDVAMLTLHLARRTWWEAPERALQTISA